MFSDKQLKDAMKRVEAGEVVTLDGMTMSISKKVKPLPEDYDELRKAVEDLLWLLPRCEHTDSSGRYSDCGNPATLFTEKLVNYKNADIWETTNWCKDHLPSNEENFHIPYEKELVKVIEILNRK